MQYNTTFGDLASKQSNSTECKIYYPEVTRMLAGIADIFLCIIGFVGNSLTIFAVFNCPKLRKKDSSWLVANLALSDLVFSLICLPVHAISFLMGSCKLGEAFCHFKVFLSHASVFTSINSLLLITINRYIAIVHTTVYPAVYTKLSVVVQIIFVWGLMYGLLFLPWFELWGRFHWNEGTKRCKIIKDNLGRSPKLVFHIVGQMGPCALMVVLYALIFFYAWRSGKKVLAFRSDAGGKNENITKREIQLAKTMLVTLLVLLVSYTPNTVLNIFGKNWETPGINATVQILASSAATTNFMLYAAFNPQYRKAYRRCFDQYFPQLFSSRSEVTLSNHP